MSTPADYVTFLNRNGVDLWVDNGQLRYHAKKGVLSSEELARLRSMKSEIIEELTKADVSAANNQTYTSTPNGVEAPVSFQQWWLLQWLEAHPNWKATLSYTFHLKGELDCVALERSLRGISRKHESLRTRIVRNCGEWRQQIEPGDGFQLSIMDVSGESDAERRQHALLAVQSIAAQELDPVVAPLMTAQMIRVSTQEHFLVVLVHRLASDCLGLGQAFRDLWGSYVETVQKGSSTSIEGPTRYRDYAQWQRSTDGAWRQKHGAYWNDYLYEAKPLCWPVKEYATPASRDKPGKLTSMESPLGEALSSRLKELGRQTQTLPALVMLTLYVACLSIWCGQKDVVMPFIIAGRTAAQEGVVGCFCHIVHLRIRLEGRENFLELLKRVSNEFYRAAAFRQDSGRMAAEKPELLRGTLCQWLSWHPAEIAGLQSDSQTSELGLEVKHVRRESLEELTNVPPDMVELEMNFFFDAAGDVSTLAIYRTDRFAESTVEKMMREFRSVAEQVVRDSRALLTE